MRDVGEVEVERTSNGSLALRVSNALGRLHKELAGRGPTRVRTYIEEDLIVCVLEGGFTRAERTIGRQSGDAAVTEMRSRLQAAMRPAMVDAVQMIAGREVRSFMSANDPSRDVQVEIMLLRPAQQARALP